jgi:hypothetical protein
MEQAIFAVLTKANDGFAALDHRRWKNFVFLGDEEGGSGREVEEERSGAAGAGFTVWAALLRWEIQPGSRRARSWLPSG